MTIILHLDILILFHSRIHFDIPNHLERLLNPICTSPLQLRALNTEADPPHDINREHLELNGTKSAGRPFGRPVGRPGAIASSASRSEERI